MEAVNPWTEMREYLHDWIEETKMDLYPDPHSRFYEGYLQALDEVLDYVAGKEEQDGQAGQAGRVGVEAA